MWWVKGGGGEGRGHLALKPLCDFPYQFLYPTTSTDRKPERTETVTSTDRKPERTETVTSTDRKLQRTETVTGTDRKPVPKT